MVETSIAMIGAPHDPHAHWMSAADPSLAIDNDFRSCISRTRSEYKRVEYGRTMVRGGG
jgi:hypothetical protein